MHRADFCPDGSGTSSRHAGTKIPLRRTRRNESRARAAGDVTRKGRRPDDGKDSFLVHVRPLCSAIAAQTRQKRPGIERGPSVKTPTSQTRPTRLSPTDRSATRTGCDPQSRGDPNTKEFPIASAMTTRSAPPSIFPMSPGVDSSSSSRSVRISRQRSVSSTGRVSAITKPR